MTIIALLSDLDYVAQGFESQSSVPKIIVAKTADEADRYLNGTTIAISGIIVSSEAESKKASGLGYPWLTAEPRSRNCGFGRVKVA